MECKNTNCLCQNNCAFFGRCTLDHILLQPNLPHVIKVVESIPGEKKRLRAIINFMQEQQPPKVSGAQINGYYWMIRKNGVDVDRQGKYMNLENPKFSSGKKFKKKFRKFNDSSFVMFAGRKCKLYGFLDRNIGNGTHQYQSAYYDEREEKYIFIVNNQLRAYYKKNIEQFVKPFVKQVPTK